MNGLKHCLIVVVATILTAHAVRAEASVEPKTEEEIKPLRSLPALIDYAEEAIERFDREVKGYTCVLLKRELIEGKLDKTQVIELKIRPRKIEDSELVIPRSIYAKFNKPADVAGREVLYVENQRNGEFLVRRGGRRLPNLTLELHPDSPLAKAETNHSILDVGIRPMLSKLLDRMKNQLEGSTYELKFFENAKIDGRLCEHIEIRQLERRPDLDYQLAKVYIDRELRLPVYFSSYAWANQPDGKPILQEQYVLTDVNLKADLTELDFDRANPKYLFKEETKSRDN